MIIKEKLIKNNQQFNSRPQGDLCRMVLSFLLLSMFSSGVAHAASPVGERHSYKVGEREMSLYITNPSDWQASDSRPAILFFHGGSWTKGKPGQFTEHSKY
jgi:acetyl esterase/lipase